MRKTEYKIKTGLYTMEDIVKDILEHIPEARDNDYYLTYEVTKRLAPEELYRTYRDYLLQEKKLVSFKTIERARRKVQSKYPELQAKEKVHEQRLEYQNAFTEYGIEDHVPMVDYNIGE